MKRDMDLIRMLLLRQETGEAPQGLAEYPESLIIYNVALMKDADLIEAAIAEGPGWHAQGRRNHSHDVGGP
jgi:hypothetical protein